MRPKAGLGMTAAGLEAHPAMIGANAPEPQAAAGPARGPAAAGYITSPERKHGARGAATDCGAGTLRFPMVFF